MHLQSWKSTEWDVKIVPPLPATPLDDESFMQGFFQWLHHLFFTNATPFPRAGWKSRFTNAIIPSRTLLVPRRWGGAQESRCPWIPASFDTPFPWPSNVSREQKPVVTPSTIGVVDEDEHHVLRPGTVVNKLDNQVVGIRSRFGKVQGLIDPNTTRVTRRSVGPSNWLGTLSHCLPAGACVGYFPTCRECYCMHRPMQPLPTDARQHWPCLAGLTGTETQTNRVQVGHLMILHMAGTLMPL
jgi:hypothetical protein